MLYLLHKASDLDVIKGKIVPLFSATRVQLKEYPLEENFNINKDDVLITHLSDKELREFVLTAVQKDWKFAVLPHGENLYISEGLGLSKNLEEVISDIVNRQKPHKLDLLLCNGQPVFQSVKAGHIFALDRKESGRHLIKVVMSIIRRMKRASSRSHIPFEITSGEEKIVNTSALGIVAGDYASSSVIANRLIEKNALNDGKFSTFILSPQNLMSLLWFFLKSLWTKERAASKTPSFIGSIRAEDLTLKTYDETEFTIDGRKFLGNTLDFHVKKKAIQLFQDSAFLTNQGENDNKTLKIGGLPTGEAKEELIQRRIPILPRASSEQFEELFKVLRKNSETSAAYLMMMILSTLIATFGLYGDSSPVIIGAMILAPIISPVVSFAMGMVRSDLPMLKKSLVTIIIGTVVALFIAAGVTIVIPLKLITPEVEARLSPNLLDLGIAVASGVAAAYAHAKEGIAKSLAGVAIAVALVPPLAVSGIGLGWMDWNVFSGAILLYATNLAGIIMFAGLTFLLLGYAPFKRAKIGLTYMLVMVALVAIPLTLSFNRIMKEAQITKNLEGIAIDKIVLRDVKVRFGDPLVISLNLVGSEAMEPEKIAEIKEEIEWRVGEPVALEVVSVLAY